MLRICTRMNNALSGILDLDFAKAYHEKAGLKIYAYLKIIILMKKPNYQHLYDVPGEVNGTN